MASHENTLRARVYNFYSKNIQSGKLYTVRHFMAERVPKTTLYDDTTTISLRLDSLALEDPTLNSPLAIWPL
jgi:hypothetical protein